MYQPLWTSLVVAMQDDIENTSVRTDHCNNSHIPINRITNRGKASMMLHTCIQIGDRNTS